ncbi:nucleolar and coiled-body phosphoprotein 1-like isoform X4 [Ornithorhynchus anatinus]|uniref:nucleolar and coiled-body phosphoprotein 1-like isoform X4 n=1 Tax=Ornithorhynchus anatinus TaxID=9258 RepID=UPI0010A7CC73|nr:nucleolar and coiled-body phosphoprotein 1-like isoform X4 [Ornithorhynchus anatinus]
MKREVFMGRNARTRDRENEAAKMTKMEQVLLPKGRADQKPNPTSPSAASTVTCRDSSSKLRPQNPKRSPVMVGKGPDLQAAQKTKESRLLHGRPGKSNLECKATKGKVVNFPKGPSKAQPVSTSTSIATTKAQGITSSREDPGRNRVLVGKNPDQQGAKKKMKEKRPWDGRSEKSDLESRVAKMMKKEGTRVTKSTSASISAASDRKQPGTSRSKECQQNPGRNQMLVGKNPDQQGTKNIRGKRPWDGRSEKSDLERRAVKTEMMVSPGSTPKAKPTNARTSTASTPTQAGTSSQKERKETPKKRVMGRKTADPKAVEKLNKSVTNFRNKKERVGQRKAVNNISVSKPNSGSTSTASTSSRGASSSKEEQDEVPKKRMMARKTPDPQAGKRKSGELMMRNGKEGEGARKNNKSAATEPTILLKNISGFQPKEGSYSTPLARSVEELCRDEIYSDEKVVVVKDNYAPIPNHWLVLSKEPISGLEAVTKEHIKLVKHMQAVGWKLIEGCAASDHFQFRTGFHTLPNIRHIPLHVISPDFISSRLKDKNYFNIKCFLDSQDVIKILENDGKVNTSG